MHWTDRVVSWFSPNAALRRVRSRKAIVALQRYDAASHGRRTKGWKRTTGDAETIASRSLVELRMHARDLMENNGYARRARRVLVGGMVGWGTKAKAIGPDAEKAQKLWSAWADTTQCDAAGKLTYAGLEALVARHLVTDGECLIRKRPRRLEDGFAIPLQLEVLEADYLDSSRDADSSQAGGPIINGIEYDKLNRRAAYWLFDGHPGSRASINTTSRRIPASEIHHAFDPERAGQGRGISWLAAAIIDLKDLSDYDDAELVKQKIAACFAGFVVDADGVERGIGERSEDEPMIEGFQPGMIQSLGPGQDIKFASPPQVANDSVTTRTLQRVAAGLGITYEDLTGDYSRVTFSSARMGRMVFTSMTQERQRDIFVPMVARVWSWSMGAAVIAGDLREVPVGQWTSSPLPQIEPDAEVRTNLLRIRSGQASLSEVLRELGYDPDVVLNELSADIKKLDELGLTLDIDARKTTQAGLASLVPVYEAQTNKASKGA